MALIVYGVTLIQGIAGLFGGGLGTLFCSEFGRTANAPGTIGGSPLSPS